MPTSGRSQPPKKHDSADIGREDDLTRNSLQRQPIFCPSDWITRAEAARIRGVTRQAIAKLVRKGSFETLQIAGNILLKRADVLAYTPKSGGRPSKS